MSAEDQVTNQAADLSLNPQKPGGGGGPKFSFASSVGAASFNPGAFEFVPSWETPAAEPVYQEKQEYYQEEYYEEKPKAVSVSLGAPAKTVKPVSEPKETPKKAKEVKSTPALKDSPPKPQVPQVEEKDEEIDISQLKKEHLNMIFMGHVHPP